MKDIIRNKIKYFILGNFLFVSDVSIISDDTSFLEKGIIDSTGILEIVGFLEEEFEIKVEDEEMLPVNLDSIRFIVEYVSRKLAIKDKVKEIS